MTRATTSWKVVTRSPEETIRLGREIGSRLRKDDVITLFGDLGAGKTTITKGMASGLCVVSDIFSPTFTIIHEHRGAIPLYHIDLYRLSVEGAADLGLDECFCSGGVCVVEWGERLGELAPGERLEIIMTFAGDDERAIEFIAHGERFQAFIEELRHGYSSDRE